MKKLLIVALLLALAAPMTGIAKENAASGSLPAPEVLAVKFHADWCGSCKKMGPIFEDLRNKYDGRPVLFVTLDLTNGTTRSQAEYLAAALGFGETYAEHSGTGFILLLDGSSREVLAKLTADQNIKEMGSELVRHLESR